MGESLCSVLHGPQGKVQSTQHIAEGQAESQCSAATRTLFSRHTQRKLSCTASRPTPLNFPHCHTLSATMSPLQLHIPTSLHSGLGPPDTTLSLSVCL